MSNFSHVSSKVKAVIVPGDDTAFFEKVEHALLLGSTRKSPVSVEKWCNKMDETLLLYLGIIVLNSSTVNKVSVESLAITLTKVIPNITGPKESPLSEAKIIFCNEESQLIISSFCDLHSLEMETLVGKCTPISYWSIFRQNCNRQQNFKPSRRPALVQ